MSEGGDPNNEEITNKGGSNIEEISEVSDPPKEETPEGSSSNKNIPKGSGTNDDEEILEGGGLNKENIPEGSGTHDEEVTESDTNDEEVTEGSGLNKEDIQEGRDTNDEEIPKESDTNDEAIPENSGLSKEELPELSGTNEEEMPKKGGLNKEDILEGSGTNDEEILERGGLNRKDIPEGSDTNDEKKPKWGDLNKEDIPEGSGTNDEKKPEGGDLYKEDIPAGSGTNDEKKSEGGDLNIKDIPEGNGTNNEKKLEGGDLNKDDIPKGSGTNNGKKPEGSDLNKEDIPEGSGTNDEEIPEGSGLNKKDIPKASGTNNGKKPEGSDLNKENIPEESGTNDEEIPKGSGLNKKDIPKASGTNNGKKPEVIDLNKEDIPEGSGTYKKEISEFAIGSDSVVIDITNSLEWNSYDPSTHSISIVPDFLRGVNKEAYDPTIVAIGPVHHNSEHLQGMEKHKMWYLQQLLVRTGTNNVNLYLGFLRDREQRARKYYSGSIELPGADKFVKMLLLDGVFIIELARRWSSKMSIMNDFIFQYSEVHYNEVLIQIRRDLLMIENQVPFFILHELYELTKEDAEPSLCCLLLRFFRRIIPGEPEVDDVRIKDYDVDDHILGLVYQAYFSDKTFDLANNHKRFMFHEIYSTSELQEAGIQFKVAETTTLMNVKFSKGVIKIPKLEVGDITESIFRNLIAYEQIRVDDENTKADDNPRFVTEYCFLMQFLVNSTKDVEILRRAGIVINWLGDDETVRLFFNKLTKNVATSQDFYYAHTIRCMNEYCTHRRNRWLAIIKRNIIDRPWVLLSILASVILLFLTATQTWFTAVPFILPKQKKA